MSDIVERLRTWTHSVHAVPVSDMLDEAADEIERLRRQRNDWMETARAFDDHLATMRVVMMERLG